MLHPPGWAQFGFSYERDGMFDNLIARAIVPVTIAVTGFVIFGCLLLYSFIKGDMTAEASRQLQHAANTVIKATKSAMMEDNSAAIQNIVTNVGTRADIELLKIYDQRGQVHYTGREMPRTLASTIDEHLNSYLEPQGTPDFSSRYEVDHDNGHIAVTLPIPNEAKCSTAACHAHAESDEVLGFLSIALSSDELEKTLALLQNRMVIFSLMVLFLTIGGVTALLRVNLFLPVLRLSRNAQLAAQGATEAELPDTDHKLGRLNEDFRQLVKQRDQARQELAEGDGSTGSLSDSQ